MKKFVIALACGLAAVGVWAACSGPYCFDDTGASVQGQVIKNLAVKSVATASIATTTPGVTGELLFCSDCTRSRLCISSGTAVGAWVVAVETGTMSPLTHCQ